MILFETSKQTVKQKSGYDVDMELYFFFLSIWENIP